MLLRHQNLTVAFLARHGSSIAWQEAYEVPCTELRIQPSWDSGWDVVQERPGAEQRTLGRELPKDHDGVRVTARYQENGVKPEKAIVWLSAKRAAGALRGRE